MSMSNLQSAPARELECVDNPDHGFQSVVSVVRQDESGIWQLRLACLHVAVVREEVAGDGG